jgi:FG-GAP-like repeat/Insecticide toxin TcdB middle/N-terminal region
MTTYWSCIGNGDGSFSYQQISFPGGESFSSGAFIPLIGDFNGDGKSDFAIAVAAGLYVFLGNGDGTFTALPYVTYPSGWGSLSLSSLQSAIGDFNSDGRTEFLLLSASTQYTFISNGDGTFSMQNATLPYGGIFTPSSYPAISGDFNGDGSADFVFQGSTLFYPFLNNVKLPAMITGFQNGLGATTSVTYQPLTASSVYTKDTNAVFPVQDIQSAMYVASRIDAANGIGGTYSTTYTYVGAKIDLSGLGFLGFRQTTATDLQTNIVHTSNFRQDYPYIGMVASETKVLGTTTLNSVTNTYQVINAFGGTTVSTPNNASSPYRVSVAASSAASTDLNGAVMPTVTTTSQYDAYGNPTQVVVSTPDGFSRTTTNTYSNDTTNWFLGRLTGATVTSTTP